VIATVDIAALLRHTKRIAVVGLSPKPHRESYGVARYMQAAGFSIIPINPVVAASIDPFILGQRCYASLSEAAQHSGIDMVNVFRNAVDVPPVADEAIAIGAHSLWLQLGIWHDAAAAKARSAGLVVVQDTCLKIAHRNLPLGVPA
jgi:uncharacterized protein